MPPTPPPVIINMPDTGAPWWGVPLLAGLFVVIGAGVTFLSTWSSDRRKTKREKQDKHIKDTREAATELLTTGREIENLVMMQETKGRALDAREYLRATMDNMVKLKAVWAEFELQSMKETLKPGEQFFASILALVLPTADSTTRMNRLNSYSTARADFVNSLRTAAGLSTIDKTPGKMISRDEFEAKYGTDWKDDVEALLKRHPPRRPDDAESGEDLPEEPENKDGPK